MGYSTGALAIGGIGTVAYVDGDKVWAFGHPFEGTGARNLLLQDAYVYDVIGGSGAATLGPYKLAAAGHDLGTFSNDALTAIVGRTGPLPATVPISIFVRDLDAGKSRTDVTRVADEASVGLPAGVSPLAYVAPLAMSNAGSILKGSPARVSGRMCMRIKLVELPDGVRFCNRYVFGGILGATESFGLNLVAGLAASDTVEATTLIDGYRFGDLHVTSMEARLDLERGANQAFMRRLRLPARVRPGQRVKARIGITHVGGRRETITQTVRIPRDVRRGPREIILTGTDSDDGAGDIFGSITTLIIGGEGGSGGGDPGARSVKQLGKAIRGIGRYDGVWVKVGGRRGRGNKAFKRAELRLSGRVSAFVRVR
jgi:hypothetical protein